MKHSNKNSKGAINLIVALGLVAFLGFLCLVVDLGWLYYNKSILQGAVDASAASAGNALIQKSDQQKISELVYQMLRQNGVDNNDANVEVFVTSNSERVYIEAKRNVQYFLAGIFGITESTIHAGKRVEIVINSKGDAEFKLLPSVDEETSNDYDIVPWGIPEGKWDYDEYTGFYKEFTSGISEYRVGEEYVLKLGTEYIDLHSNEEIDIITIPELHRTYNEEATESQADEDQETALGDIMPWGLVAPSFTDDHFGLVKGQKYMLKLSSVKAPEDVHNYHGNFGALSLGGNGGDIYRTNIKFGYQGLIDIGMLIDTEPGNMVGPTVQGIQYRIDNNKLAIRIPIVNTLEVNGKKPVVLLGVKRFILSELDSAKGFVYGYFTDGGDATNSDVMYYFNDPLAEIEGEGKVDPASLAYFVMLPKNARSSQISNPFSIKYLTTQNIDVVEGEVNSVAKKPEITDEDRKITSLDVNTSLTVFDENGNEVANSGIYVTGVDISIFDQIFTDSFTVDLSADQPTANGKMTAKVTEAWNNAPAGYSIKIDYTADFQHSFFEPTIEPPVVEEIRPINSAISNNYNVNLEIKWNPATQTTTYKYSVSPSGAIKDMDNFHIFMDPYYKDKIVSVNPTPGGWEEIPAIGFQGVKFHQKTSRNSPKPNEYSIILKGYHGAQPSRMSAYTNVHNIVALDAPGLPPINWIKEIKTPPAKTGSITILKLRTNHGILDFNCQESAKDPEEYKNSLEFGYRNMFGPIRDIDVLPMILNQYSYAGTLFNYSQDTENTYDTASKESQRFVIVPVVSSSPTIYNVKERGTINIGNYFLFYLSKPIEPIKYNGTPIEYRYTNLQSEAKSGEIRGVFVKNILE